MKFVVLSAFVASTYALTSSQQACFLGTCAGNPTNYSCIENCLGISAVSQETKNAAEACYKGCVSSNDVASGSYGTCVVNCIDRYIAGGQSQTTVRSAESIVPTSSTSTSSTSTSSANKNTGKIALVGLTVVSLVSFGTLGLF
ncbi:hypothetical protein AX774_g525 [Zancudomyces culisetae]|uniref:Uncharacterized protein n=1 Tax=Zancudomyces culisetae TaxID=1213189 RepID=A0A1R1PYA9_ZANCU|nr:hypothetical protein AX774_g525 [Zancudomyces culisetae]|eukprot:OMH85908.1 hypothetical protein AX774_g525 [Zancudomyces culisetae]